MNLRFKKLNDYTWAAASNRQRITYTIWEYEKGIEWRCCNDEPMPQFIETGIKSFKDAVILCMANDILLEREMQHV